MPSFVLLVVFPMRKCLKKGGSRYLPGSRRETSTVLRTRIPRTFYIVIVKILFVSNAMWRILFLNQILFSFLLWKRKEKETFGIMPLLFHKIQNKAIDSDVLAASLSHIAYKHVDLRVLTLLKCMIWWRAYAHTRNKRTHIRRGGRGDGAQKWYAPRNNG